MTTSEQYGKMRASSTAKRKHRERISQMPDDILVSIISHLNSQEAAATSILSPRWRYLSTYATRLHFPKYIPRYNTLHDIDQNLIRSFPHYINTINRVLDSHKGARIKEFRVYTYRLKGATINKWFEFALAKDVEILHIHLGIAIINRHNMHAYGHYPLGENLNLMGETLICLKELTLFGIDVNDGEIQFLLDKFPILESLSITRASSLRNISIVGHSSSKLKHLEISAMDIEFELLEIDNFVNLVSLRCFKLAFSLNIKNVPRLIEFRMCDNNNWLGCSSALILSKMPSLVRHQLQTLEISIDPYSTGYDERRPPLQLNGLKYLELQLFVDDYEKIDFNPFYLFRACPSLEKLEIKFSWVIPSLIERDEDCEEEIDLNWPRMKVGPNLKKMKISGFVGSPPELEIIFSILKNVNTLEELVVETYDKEKKFRKLVRERARRHFRHNIFKVVII